MRRWMSTAALSTALMCSASSLADIELNTRLDRGDVVVSSVPVAGTKVPEVTATGVIDAPPEAVWAILQDCENYHLTMVRVSRSHQLSRTDEVVVCEVELDLPFPVSNLVSVTAARQVSGPPEWTRTWYLLRGDYKVNHGSWTLTAFDGDSTRTLAVYQLHAVPKSMVPGPILRQAQKRALPRMFDKLRKLTSTQLASLAPEQG